MRASEASAVWEGGLKGGKGTFQAGTGAFQGPYTFATRFESAKGTNPEELIAAAHAACFSMALSSGLEKAGTPPTRISTRATVTMDSGKISKIRLETRGTVPGANAAGFQKAAEGAKDGCPVSQLVKNNTAIELDATLE